MQQLGTTFNISNELLKEGEQAIYTIYGHKQQHNVSEFRYYLCVGVYLPPTWTWLEGESKHYH